MVFDGVARLAVAAASENVSLISHDWWTYQVVSGVGGVTNYDPWPSVEYREHGENLIGSNIGLRQRALRLRAFAGGRVIKRNDTNINALSGMPHLLSSPSLDTLERFSSARRSALPHRIHLFWT